MKQLWKSHRTFGFEVARAKREDGRELVIIQTSAHKQEVSPAHMLMPVLDKEVEIEATGRLIEVIVHARFLSLDDTAIRAAFEVALTIEN